MAEDLPTEITRAEIAALLGVTPERVSQLLYIPKPVRKVNKFYRYNRTAVMEAIEQFHGLPDGAFAPPPTLDTFLLQRFLFGEFDREDQRSLYNSLRFWAKIRKPITQVIHANEEFDVRGPDKGKTLKDLPHEPSISVRESLWLHSLDCYSPG